MAAAPKAAKGSEAAIPAAQQAAIGAKICTAKANMTIGRNFRNRRRISLPFSIPRSNHQQSPKSRSGSRRYLVGSRELTCHGRCRRLPPHSLQKALIARAKWQSNMTKSQSFRGLLEF